MEVFRLNRGTLEALRRIGRQVERLAEAVEAAAEAAEQQANDQGAVSVEEAEAAREWLVWAAEEHANDRMGPADADGADLDVALDAVTRVAERAEQ